ncbi:MAG: RICIN domain-containing protein [Gemmatimonadaceae bacterium]|nr:RICIN domain-containing protein [Gemmatimonadaceae bacterium]
MKKLAGVLALVAAVAGSAPTVAGAQTVFSGVGGVCMNVEGGVIEGARIIGWYCGGGANEKFVVTNGVIRLQGTNYCVASDGRAQGAQLRLRTCNGDVATQNFAVWANSKIGHNSGYCVDLSGAGWFGQNNGGNRPVILWPCSGDRNRQWAGGARNQQWFAGSAPRTSIATAALRRGAVVAIAGRPGTYTWNGSSLVGNDGASLIGNDGSTLIAVNAAGQMVAAGGGNMVAAGGGN